MTMRPLFFPTSPKRILIIKPSAIGDVVHALPIWKLLRTHWPHAKISWLVTPACAGLIDGLPDLDLIRFDRRRFGKAWSNWSSAVDLIRFTRDLRNRQFDLVIDLQGLFRSGWLAWQTHAPIRIGFRNAREWGWMFYTHRVPIDTMEQHAIARYLKIAEALGCGNSPVEFQFPTTDEDRATIAAKLPADRPFAVILPGTNWATKRWPVQNFAALVAPLRERFGLETVVAGGPDDIELASQILAAVNLAGQTSLRQLVALLERADLVIANDSGPMHIASALGRPLVTIFGPTNPIRTGPFGRLDCVVRANINCSPCYSRKCSHHRCMKELDPTAVLVAAEVQLGNGLKNQKVIGH